MYPLYTLNMKSQFSVASVFFLLSLTHLSHGLSLPSLTPKLPSSLNAIESTPFNYEKSVMFAKRQSISTGDENTDNETTVTLGILDPILNPIKGITDSIPFLPSGIFSGGGILPFLAGIATQLGLQAVLITSKAVAAKFPGFWGAFGVFVYAYIFLPTIGVPTIPGLPGTVALGVTGDLEPVNISTYNVTCYCMQYNPCSCEKVQDVAYFQALPSNVSVKTTEGNVMYVYINGTLENSTHTCNSAPSGIQTETGMYLTVTIAVISLFV